MERPRLMKTHSREEKMAKVGHSQGSPPCVLCLGREVAACRISLGHVSLKALVPMLQSGEGGEHCSLPVTKHRIHQLKAWQPWGLHWETLVSLCYEVSQLLFLASVCCLRACVCMFLHDQFMVELTQLRVFQFCSLKAQVQ